MNFACGIPIVKRSGIGVTKIDHEWERRDRQRIGEQGWSKIYMKKKTLLKEIL